MIRFLVTCALACLLCATNAYADFGVKRGHGGTIYFPLIKAGSNDFAVAADYTYAAGDFKISVDGGTAANPTNTPTYDTNARMWSLTLAAAETRGRLIMITCVDAATKAVEDQGIVIETDSPFFSTEIATLASQTSFTLQEGSGDNDSYNGYMILLRDQTTNLQTAVGIVRDYTGSTKTITLDADPGIFTMATGDFVELIPPANINAINGYIIIGGGTSGDQWRGQ